MHYLLITINVFDKLTLVHYNKKIMKIGRYVIGLLSGLTFGMLFAPKKGKELRKNITKKSSESGTEGFKVLAEAFLEAGGEAWEEVKNLSEHEQVEAALDITKEKLKEYLGLIEERGYDVASVAQGKLEEIADLATSKAKQFKNKAHKKRRAAKKTVTKKVTFAKRRVSKKVAKAVKKARPKTRKSRK
jgi:gas vesicle protein